MKTQKTYFILLLIFISFLACNKKNEEIDSVLENVQSTSKNVSDLNNIPTIPQSLPTTIPTSLPSSLPTSLPSGIKSSSQPAPSSMPATW